MKVMLCLPTFLTQVSPDRENNRTIVMRRSHITSFQKIIQSLEATGHKVYSALRLYEWENGNFASPRDAVQTDWHEVNEADHVVACPVIGGQASKGVHLEIGWATALKKPVTVLVHGARTEQTVMVTGLRGVSDFAVRLLFYQEDPLERIQELMACIAQPHGGPAGLRVVSPPPSA